MTDTQRPPAGTVDKIVAWDVTHDGNPRHALVRLHVGTPVQTTTTVFTIEEATQLLAQLPQTLGDVIAAAKRQRSGIVVAPAGTFDDPRIRTQPQTG